MSVSQNTVDPEAVVTAQGPSSRDEWLQILTS